MIKTHLDLKSCIQGKRILCLCSFGKDSILLLHWLINFARVDVVAIGYLHQARHPGLNRYIKYIQKKMPQVNFIFDHSPQELSGILQGRYQSPIEKLTWINHQEHEAFDFNTLNEEYRKDYHCDYIATGISRYESFQRACFFQQNGLMKDKFIYPLGNMSKAQVYQEIKNMPYKLHPSYKLHDSTLDTPSWYKMRASFIAYPEYKKAMYQIHPLLELDEYRYTQLLGK